MVSKQQPNGKQSTTKISEKGSRLRFYSADTVKHTAVNGGCEVGYPPSRGYAAKEIRPHGKENNTMEVIEE